MSGYLLLGPVMFQGFELPASIGFGGGQRLAVHRLPGGARVIDAMGRDDAPLSWSGTFAGSDATLRARLLDLLRAQGSPLPLAWDCFAYLVVIERFTASYEHVTWVPYQISCTVVADQSAVFARAATSLLDGVTDDLQTAASGVDVSGALAAMTAAGAATPGTAAYDAAAAAVAAAGTQASAGMAQASTQLLAAGDPVSAATAAGSLAQLADAQGFLGRAANNLSDALG
jgi:hypothetical protein